MDKLSAMKTFVQIVDRGSLTQAAEALDTSLPTVVRTLANLEDYLGVRLLNRTTRRIALTLEGRQYLERCRGILTDIDEAEQLLSQHQQVPKGLVTLSAPVLFGQLHVAPAITEFLKRNAQLQAKLILFDRVINLVEDGVDLAVRIGKLSDSSLVAVPVGSIRQVVCASPSYLEEAGVPGKPEDLGDINAIRVTAMSSYENWQFKDRDGTIIQVPVSGSFTCNRAAAAIDACVSGLGFGMFLSYQVQHHLARQELTLVLREYEIDPIPVHIVYPHAKLMSPRVRFCLDWLSQSLKKTLKHGPRS